MESTTRSPRLSITSSQTTCHPGLTLPSTHKLSRHTSGCSPSSSLASTSAPFSLVPHPPPTSLPPPSNASSCCSQPLASLVLSPLQGKHPASRCLRLCLTFGKGAQHLQWRKPHVHGVPLTPASTEARVHTFARTVWVHEPHQPPHAHTQPRHRHTHTQTHTQPLTHSHTLHRTRRCTRACTCELPHHQGMSSPSSPGWETAGWPPEYPGDLLDPDRDVCPAQKAG